MPTSKLGNQVIACGQQLVAMKVQGPNSRQDFHCESGEEFFYQLQGEIEIELLQEATNSIKSVRLSQGESFLLSAKVAHRVKRPLGSVGLVVELNRSFLGGEGEKDLFLWIGEDGQVKKTVELFVDDLNLLEDQLNAVDEE